MPGRVMLLVAALAGVLGAGYLAADRSIAAQSPSRTSDQRFAAVPSQKGGQDIFGAYDVVADWPKDLTTIKGHEGWTFGAGQSVFAESPNRIFVLQRGELPNLGRPKAMRLTELGPGLVFPIGRLPWRDATTASPPGNGGTGQPAEGGMQAWEKQGNKFGVDARWEHCIMIFDGQGNLIDRGTSDDSMLQRPHFVDINPYDPEKHVWIVDDHKHVVTSSPTTARRSVQTIGTYGEPRADDKHFNRPTFMDWFPDGSFVVADGYNGTRVVKFDKDGKYLTAWGQRGEAGKETRPGYFNNVHGIAVDPQDAARLRQRSRQQARAGLRRKRQVPLRMVVRDAAADIHLFHIFSDGYLWAADRGTNKMLKYDLDGNFMYSWGTWGDFPGGMWGVHGFSVDQEGNVYVAEVDNGGAQKYTPRKGANPAMLMGKPLRVAWK